MFSSSSSSSSSFFMSVFGCICPNVVFYVRSLSFGSPPSDSSLKVSQVVKGEMSAKTTYQRSAKGPITISECSPDGSYVTIENTGRRVSPYSASPKIMLLISRLVSLLISHTCVVCSSFSKRTLEAGPSRETWTAT